MHLLDSGGFLGLCQIPEITRTTHIQYYRKKKESGGLSDIELNNAMYHYIVN